GIGRIAEDFHDRHRRTYGHDNRAEPVQIVSVRLAAVGTITPFTLRDEPSGSARDAVKHARPAWFRETGIVNTPVYDRRRTPAGLIASGPAVIESLESTVLVPPAWQARMDADGFVLLTPRAREATE